MIQINAELCCLDVAMMSKQHLMTWRNTTLVLITDCCLEKSPFSRHQPKEITLRNQTQVENLYFPVIKQYIKWKAKNHSHEVSAGYCRAVLCGRKNGRASYDCQSLLSYSEITNRVDTSFAHFEKSIASGDAPYKHRLPRIVDATTWHAANKKRKKTLATNQKRRAGSTKC